MLAVLLGVSLASADALSVAAGPSLRDDRDTWYLKAIGPGLALQADYFPSSLGVRLDITPWFGETYDQLNVVGPQVSAMALYSWQDDRFWPGRHLTADVGFGPGVWAGRSQWWDGTYFVLLPGLRASTGVDYRLSRRVALRAELTGSYFWSRLPLLSGDSDGFEARLMLKVFDH